MDDDLEEGNAIELQKVELMSLREEELQQGRQQPMTPIVGLGIYPNNNGLPSPMTEGNRHDSGNDDANDKNDSNDVIYIVDDDDDDHRHDESRYSPRCSGRNYRQYLQQQQGQQHVDDSPIIERSRRRRERLQRYRRPTAQEKKRAIRKALKKLMDDDVVRIRYRSKAQGEALRRIMDGGFNVLTVVLPTAGGKTLLFTAPACLEEDVGGDHRGGTVPQAHRRDGARSTEDCEEWSHSTVDPEALVVVSVDKMHDHF